MKDLDRPGPWALITGAEGGIGRTLVDRFKESGFRVIGTDLDGGSGRSDVFIPLDLVNLVHQAEAQREFRARVRKIVGVSGLSALVNNAAVQILGSVRELEVTDLSRTLDVNVVAAFVLTKALLDDLILGTGAVVNVSSIHARLTKPAFVAYATSKAALSGLTRALGVEVGAQVRVNAIAPGAVQTPMLSAGFEANPDAQKVLADLHPVGRIGSADEVADLALFLVSDKARFINGSVHELDGGMGARLHDSR